jgi:hypothetical protein
VGGAWSHALPDVCRVLPVDERHGAMYVSTLRLTPRILRRLQSGGVGARDGADGESESDAELPVSLTLGEGGTASLRVGDDTFVCELHRETEADAGKNVPELFLLSDDGLDLIDMGVSHARMLVNAGIDESDASALQKQQLSDARMARQQQYVPERAHVSVCVGDAMMFADTWSGGVCVCVCVCAGARW